MKKFFIFWVNAAIASTIIVAAHPDVDFKQMILVAVLSLVLWICGYFFERSLAPDPWSESPVPKQKKWIASLIFYGLSICLSVYVDLGYWYVAIGAIIIIGGLSDDKKFPTRQEWFKIFESALIFALVAFSITFLFQFINFFPV